MHFLETKFLYFAAISKKFIAGGPSDNMSTSVQVMAWHLIGGKLLPKPMMAQSTDAYLHHNLNELITEKSRGYGPKDYGHSLISNNGLFNIT